MGEGQLKPPVFPRVALSTFASGEKEEVICISPRPLPALRHGEDHEEGVRTSPGGSAAFLPLLLSRQSQLFPVLPFPSSNPQAGQPRHGSLGSGDQVSAVPPTLTAKLGRQGPSNPGTSLKVSDQNPLRVRPLSLSVLLGSALQSVLLIPCLVTHMGRGLGGVWGQGFGGDVGLVWGGVCGEKRWSDVWRVWGSM